MAARNAGGHETATVDDSGTEAQKGSDTGYPRGGGPNKGLCYVLWAIEPDTLPEEGAWREVSRRVTAYQEGRDGWRTGDLETSIDDWGGDAE